MKPALCGSIHKVKADPKNGVREQWVRCVRNAGHSTGKGSHYGAAKKDDGTIRKEFWS